MPLLDHFHAPIYPRWKWESFHAAWSVMIAGMLNQDLLPEEYQAEVQSHAGPRVEIDVATLQDQTAREETGNGPTATLAQTWTIPEPVATMPSVIPNEMEILVFGPSGGDFRLVAAIELVSPRNKDRAEARRAFAVKCASYLGQGIGLILIDVVTSRLANLHNEVMRLLESPEEALLANEDPPYVGAYRTVLRNEKQETDLWPYSVRIGAELPTMPLAIAPDLVIPVDLEQTYNNACLSLRLTH